MPLYWAWLVLSWLLQRLPLRVGYAAAWVCGSVAFACWPRGRRSTLANYRRLFPYATTDHLRDLGRASLVHYCQYLVDFARAPMHDAGWFVRHCRGERQFARLRELVDEGRGVIFVFMHFGNWDLGAAATAARGFAPAVVVETFADPRLDRLVVGARERLGMRPLRMESLGPSVVKHLRRGGVLALLVDRPAPGTGVPVTFFGRETAIPEGAARLAVRTGARVVPAACPRTRPWQPAVHVLADFDVETPQTGDEARDIRELSQAIMDVQERFLRAYPEQWYMFREMWPRRGAA
jgi:KDO2-lipid IV(A) lauroyltransferase